MNIDLLERQELPAVKQGILPNHQRIALLGPSRHSILRKNAFKSALKLVMSPLAETKEKTSQLALGPFHRFHECPAIWVPVVI